MNSQRGRIPIVVFRYFANGSGLGYPSWLDSKARREADDALEQIHRSPSGPFRIVLGDGRMLIGEKQPDPKCPDEKLRQEQPYYVRSMIVDKSFSDDFLRRLEHFLHQTPLALEAGANEGLELAYEKIVVSAPVVVFRWFPKGSGLAYPAKFDASTQQMVYESLDQVHRLANGSSFRVALKDGRYLIGDKLADDECPDERARHRFPYLIRAVMVDASLPEGVIESIEERLRHLPLPANGGGSVGLELESERLVAHASTFTPRGYKRQDEPRCVRPVYEARLRSERTSERGSDSTSWFPWSFVLWLCIVGLVCCICLIALWSLFRG